jgi:hypothetical protein
MKAGHAVNKVDQTNCKSIYLGQTLSALLLSSNNNTSGQSQEKVSVNPNRPALITGHLISTKTNVKRKGKDIQC